MPQKGTRLPRKSKGVSSHTPVMHREHLRFETLVQRNLPQLQRINTFAKMLKMTPNIQKIIPNIELLLPPYCKRKDQASMSDNEKQRYICAFNLINADGTLGQLVDIHNQMHMQHTNDRLLPWHRVFLLMFEEALHNYHPDVCVPYWDWTKPEEQHFPDWLVSILPTVVTPTKTIQVTRAPQPDGNLASYVSGTAAAMALTSYNTFTAPINGIHGSVHIWVGGTMSNYDSPADPVFWLHHANLDRLWWEWYNDPAAGNHQNPPLTGTNAIFDPWTYTEPDTRNIMSLGYRYV